MINGKRGKNTGKISKGQYFLKVTPPGYFFVIWGIIYSIYFIIFKYFLATTAAALIWACIS